MKTLILVLLRIAFVLFVVGTTLTMCLVVSNEKEIGMEVFEWTGFLTLPLLFAAMLIEMIFDRD